MREVKSQLGGCNERTFLVDMIPKDFSQTEVQDMGCRVVIADGPTAKLTKAHMSVVQAMK